MTIREKSVPRDQRHRDGGGSRRSRVGPLRLIGAVAAALLVASCSTGTEDSTGTEEASPTGEATASPATEGATTAAPEPEEELVPLRFGMLEGAGTTLAPIAAREAGIFEEFGLDVEFVPIGAGGAALANFVSDSIDMTLQGPSFIANAAAEDVDLRLFCGAHESGRSTILVRADSELSTYEELGSSDEVLSQLEGRSLSVPSVGGLVDTNFISAFRELGAEDPESFVDFVPILGGAPSLAALSGGDIDAAYGYPFVTNEILASDNTELLIDLTANGPEVFQAFHSGWVAEPDFIANNGPTLQRFCEAMAEANDFVIDDQNWETIQPILAHDIGVSDEAIESIQELGVEASLYPLSTELEREPLEDNINFLVENGLLSEDAPSSYDDYVQVP